MKANSIRLAVLAAISSVALTGCFPKPQNPSTFLPQGGNRYVSLTSSSSRQDAYDWAIKNATAKCKKIGKNVRVESATNKYSGLTQQQKMASGIFGGIVGLASHGRVSSSSDESHDDNQVRLKFRCVK